MGIVFRQSVKTSIVVLSGAILGALIIYLSTKYLTKRELGFSRNFTNYALTLSNIFFIGVNSTMLVYVHRYANDENKKKLLLTFCFLVPAIITGIATIFYFLLRVWILKHFQPEDMPFMQRYFSWLPVFTLLFIYMIVLEQYLGSQMKIAVSAFMREVVLRIANIILIILLFFKELCVLVSEESLITKVSC